VAAGNSTACLLEIGNEVLSGRTQETKVRCPLAGRRRNPVDQLAHGFHPRLLVDLDQGQVRSASQTHEIVTEMRARSCRLSRSNVNKAAVGKPGKASATAVQGQCLCGRVRIEIDFPAFWAWHDHSKPSRHAHGAAYATYVGSWRGRFRITQGLADITRFEHAATRTARSFCARCGTPLLYERAHSPHMVNIPRALFEYRTGREPRYHIGIEQAPVWAYSGEKLGPLKGFPGVVWARPRSRKRSGSGGA
jgi:hypothetical protein